MSNNNNTVIYRRKKANKNPPTEKDSMSLDDQLSFFISRHTLHSKDYEKRGEIIRELASILQVRYPKVIVYPFGSLTTSLGDIHSDIDIFVDALGRSGTEMRSFPQLKPKLKGDIFKNVLKILKMNRNWCSNLIPISNARVPIIKMVHIKTNTKCDLSFENILSVQNSKLIFYYLDFDPRIRPLMLLVREWGRFHKLTSSNSIKNYTLVLIVLTFLADKNIIPPISLLQSLVKEEAKLIVDDEWDVSFSMDTVQICKRMKVDLPSQETTSALDVLSLALDFFAYFGKFDYKKLAICPFLGTYILREYFEPGKETHLPFELQRYKFWAVMQKAQDRLDGRKTPLCVQDPFNLGFNPGCTASNAILVKFHEGCKKTAELISDILQKKNTQLSSIFAYFTSSAEISKRKKRNKKKSNSKYDDLIKRLQEANEKSGKSKIIEGYNNNEKTSDKKPEKDEMTDIETRKAKKGKISQANNGDPANDKIEIDEQSNSKVK